MAELALAEDGERTLRGAEELCKAANVSILAAEHLLAAALQNAAELVSGLPDAEALAAAAHEVHGSGMTALDSQVMWGSSAREALNSTVGAVRSQGITVVSSRHIAVGVIQSGEVNPAFYTSLGVSKADLLTLLA